MHFLVLAKSVCCNRLSEITKKKSVRLAKKEYLSLLDLNRDESYTFQRR